ncbi:phenylacetic acid degradation operon negative regulatory protein PaaX [Marinomonas arenicola]|uniref:Phenylacetic acid degradation operon negative regulatory protein PaaX n=1 Tax=Marinomonas arenicola TaxID=569601 RepID=A0ABU9G8V9_9GAMM
MNELKTLNRLIQRFQSQKPIRASSLIISLYGDSIEPHGSTVWLGSLINALAPIGISERLMRTSIFRLAQDGWLNSEKVGRKSYYGLTQQGHRKFEQAFQRIYSPNIQAWNGSWQLIMGYHLSLDEKKQLMDELQWQGFATISSQLIASPCCDAQLLNNIVASLSLEDKVIVFEASSNTKSSNIPIQDLVKDAWDLDTLGQHYQEFIALFQPVWQELTEQDRLDPQSCFLARTLLIHEYRKLLLRDPNLPRELLPIDWEGKAARQLCRNIYRKLTPATEKWIEFNLESVHGPLPEANALFFERFGGLN